MLGEILAVIQLALVIKKKTDQDLFETSWAAPFIYLNFVDLEHNKVLEQTCCTNLFSHLY